MELVELPSVARLSGKGLERVISEVSVERREKVWLTEKGKPVMRLVRMGLSIWPV